MRQFLKFVMIIVALGFSIFCNANHFINDQQYRDQVKIDFEQRKLLANNRDLALFSVFNQNLSVEEKEALEFLYAYMPYSDLADYNGDYFLDQVRYSFKARDYFNWGKKIPEEIFRHFVLIYRVNNENLDTARMVIFEALKDRIKGMSMYDAALEVNHWCHEKVTYRPSDARTSSSLASIKTAFGRCGEESTLTVTALRAVGIPARQCYTPRWAHTDDNHAWVEVWVDGRWCFMGACEPDAELNMGWFAIPSTRAMMVHSNAFGKYVGSEELNFSSALFSRINMLPNYTKTKKITVKVVDNKNKIVKDALVKFKLYNYAEYYPIATGTTDESGTVSLTTGYGDLLIWANKNGIYNYAKFDVRKQDSLVVKINKQQGKEYVELLEIVPPNEIANKNKTESDKASLNNKRLHYEDSLRNAYLATFPEEEDAKLIVTENLSQNEIWNFVQKSEGNYAEIIKFINHNSQKTNDILLFEFLNSFSDKDLRDISAETLQQHLTQYDKSIPREVYVKGILPARIGLEFIRPWRQYLSVQMNSIFKNRPSASDILKWIKENISVDSEGNYFNCPISPRGVFELRYADNNSRNIFFVAACRAMNIPAYLDNATNQLFVYENKNWRTISFDQNKEKIKTGKLIINNNSKSEIKPEYWIHYTIAKYENGDFVTFDYENDPRVANFPITLDMDPGYYMLSTGNRYSDGTTLSRLDFFVVEKDKTVKKDLVVRQLEPRSNENYGKLDIAQSIKFGNKNVELKSLLVNKQLVLCFIDPTREPTKHTLKEIGQYRKQYDEWNGNILFVIPSDKNKEPLDIEKWNLPKSSIVMIDENSNWMNSILESTNQYFRDNYPLIFIVNKDGMLSFKTEGYRIGTGELIYKSLEKK